MRDRDVGSYVGDAKKLLAERLELPGVYRLGAGADVMKRIAAPMVGGMITSTVLTLVVIPAIYSLWKERELR